MEGKQTRTELLFGIVFFSLLSMAGNLLVENKLAYSLGVASGMLVAGGMVFHMYASIEKAVLYDSEDAQKKMKLSAMVRMLFAVAALITAVLLPRYLSLIGTMLGLMSLKFAAYVQPLTHKVINYFINKGR